MDNSITACARIYADLDALSRAAVEETARAAAEAVAARGRCLISLSGGHTPALTYELWATEYRDRMPWANIHFFWGDERFVPADDARNNFRMARENLIKRIPIPPENVHPIVTSFALPEQAAQEYEKVLRTYIAESGPSFDVLFLGVGIEGHTASLFPESPALGERNRWAVSVRAPAEPPVRISLTFPVLRRAREAYFLLAGADKRPIIATLRRDWQSATKKLPVAMLHPEGKVIWFLDAAANGE
jgi:6-phosphogluconolactonase